MAIQFVDGKILFVDGKIAFHEDCCCGGEEPCTDCTGTQGSITLSEAAGYLCDNPQPGDTGVYAYDSFEDLGGGDCRWIWVRNVTQVLYITNDGDVAVVTNDDTWSGSCDIPTCSGGTLTAGNISVFRTGGLATCEMVGTL